MDGAKLHCHTWSSTLNSLRGKFAAHRSAVCVFNPERSGVLLLKALMEEKLYISCGVPVDFIWASLVSGYVFLVSHLVDARLNSTEIGINWHLSKVCLAVNNIVSIISSPSNNPEFLTDFRYTKHKNANLPGDSVYSLTNPGKRSAKIRWKWNGSRYQGPSEDLDEGADGVGNIYKDSVGPALFTAVNTTAILLSLKGSDTSAGLHDDFYAACVSIHRVAIIS